MLVDNDFSLSEVVLAKEDRHRGIGPRQPSLVPTKADIATIFATFPCRIELPVISEHGFELGLPDAEPGSRFVGRTAQSPKPFDLGKFYAFLWLFHLLATYHRYSCKSTNIYKLSFN